MIVGMTELETDLCGDGKFAVNFAPIEALFAQ